MTCTDGVELRNLLIPRIFIRIASYSPYVQIASCFRFSEDLVMINAGFKKVALRVVVVVVVVVLLDLSNL